MVSWLEVRPLDPLAVIHRRQAGGEPADTGTALKSVVERGNRNPTVLAPRTDERELPDDKPLDRITIRVNTRRRRSLQGTRDPDDRIPKIGDS